jgi:hypothetical protein
LTKAVLDKPFAHFGPHIVEQSDDILHFPATSLLGLFLALSRLP